MVVRSLVFTVVVLMLFVVDWCRLLLFVDWCFCLLMVLVVFVRFVVVVFVFSVCCELLFVV